jgi:hypothetical protein
VTGQRRFTRREILQLGAFGLAAGSLAALPIPAFGFRSRLQSEYAGTNDQLLDEIQKASFHFFWKEASPVTGQIKDRALANGQDRRQLSSIAATGFGLTALCIADQRGYARPALIKRRVRRTLRFILHRLPHVHGFFYHFVHMETGQRLRKCELSSIDTTILLCGVLTARQHFADREIKDLATKIYERVDWPWMLNRGKTFSMGWLPESGFLNARRERYCELMMIYLLAIGSPSHPVSPEAWHAFSRPKINYMGLEYISGNDPLFTHQYSHAWFDFRHQQDDYANYFNNSVIATKAHKLFCLSLKGGLPDYSDDLWGITASDSVNGYTAWGGPPSHGLIDGSIVPCATGGSLPFLFDDCIRVQRTIRSRYPEARTPYSFVDAFNPIARWYNLDVIGIDLGITMLMAENHRTGFVWQTFMKNPEVTSAMQKAGFRPE